MAVSRDEILKIAKLANLELSENSIQKYGKDLNQILDYMKKLNELDTDAVEPLSHPIEFGNRFREDVVKVSEATGKIMEDAPESDGVYFRVPKVINKG